MTTLKLPQLQNLCKRDAASHREDYDAQVTRLESECGILTLSGKSSHNQNLVELIQFIAAVSSSCYRKDGEATKRATFFMNLLQNEMILQNSGNNVRDIRRSLVSALILMRNKGALKPLDLLELFFNIISQLTAAEGSGCTSADKQLREKIHRHIVNDIRNVNKNGHNQAINRKIQSFMHKVIAGVQDKSTMSFANEVAARRCVEMIVELYRRNVWTDERTIHILASAAASPCASVMTRACKFFLGIEDKMEMDASRRKDEEMAGATVNLHLHSKKTKSRQRQTERQLKKRKDKFNKLDPLMEEDQGVEHSKKLYPAIEMLNNPQGLAETVFKRLKSSGHSAYTFETKLLLINFITRLVGNQELLILPLYPFLQKYLGGHQRDVTAILAYVVQACHEYVPPDEVNGLLKAISHNFITERCTGEQMAVGINAVRAICARVPSVLADDNNTDDLTDTATTSTTMDVEGFVRDLAGYTKHRDRSVMIAGKSWVNFIREVHPSLLQGKDRGEVGSALYRNGEKPLRYGEKNVAHGVDGADLLLEYEAKKAAVAETATNDGDEWEEQSNDDGLQEEPMNDAAIEGGEIDEVSDEEGEGNAPNLVDLDKEDDGSDNGEPTIDLSKLSKEERQKLQMEASSTRIFTTSDFEKMRKLVAREKLERRDPRSIARKKRAMARSGTDFEVLSDDSDEFDSDDEDGIRITGAVNPGDIMAMAKKKRMNKAERLERVIAGREKFEGKHREGGSTNTEKKRKKNFVMQQFSFEARSKQNQKETSKHTRGKKRIMARENKKRRRK